MYVVEEEFCCVLVVKIDFFEIVVVFEVFYVCFEDEERYVFVVFFWIGFGGDDDDVGVYVVGDEGF